MADFLDFPYEDNKDMIFLSVDAFHVFTNNQAENFQLPQEDLIIFLAKYDIIEKISAILPKMIHDIETSTVLNQQE